MIEVATLPKEVNDHIDAKMQQGYKLDAEQRNEEAVDVWLALWEDIKEAMKKHNISYIEDLEDYFSGNQLILNWAMDVELIITNTALMDRNLYQKRINYLSEYIERLKK